MNDIINIDADVEKFEGRASVPAVQEDSQSMVLIAMQKGYEPALIEKMMDLAERHEKNEARKAYNEAMAAFKAQPPEIEKDKKVSFGEGKTAYSHASLANVTNKINSALSTHGLSAAWSTAQDNGNITVTCTISHFQGHSESTSLTAAPDKSGSKNSIQAIGSTISYLERYTLLALTGLSTRDMDDDGQEAETKECITTDMVTEINDLIKETSTNKKLFLKWAKSESVEAIPLDWYETVIAELNKKKSKMRQPGE